MTTDPVTPADPKTAPRGRALNMVVYGGWCTMLLPLLTAFLTGNSIVWIGGLCAIFAAMGALARHLDRDKGRTVAATALIGQVMVLTAALAGHPWQVDSHMAFFAALACLMIMNDHKAILVATGLIVVHHVTLALVFPALIYPPSSFMLNVERVLFHGAAAGIEAAALTYAVIVRNKMTQQIKEDRKRLELAGLATTDSLKKTEVALSEAETAKSEAMNAQQQAQQAAAQAEEETERAHHADEVARAAEQRDRALQAKVQASQLMVVDALGRGLNALSVKDLSYKIDETFPPEYEELRQNFNKTSESLRDAMGLVMETAGGISAQTHEIASATTDLAKRTETQAASLGEVSASVSTIVRQVNETASISRSAHQEASETISEAEQSATVVSDAVQAMGDLEESSNQIQSIIGTIENISFQTNLLALNAGVEAARAGEAGRGFAVVASEVRALAQRSSEAAHEIKTLIETSTSLVKAGVSLVNKTGDSLSSVKHRIDHISQKVGEISASAAQQSASLSEIDTALGELDQVTQQNAAMFEETSAANQELRSRTSHLLAAIEDFVPQTEQEADVEQDIKKTA